MIRAIAERFSRNRVIRRRLPASVGGLPLFVSPDSQLKYLKPGIDAFDASLLQLAKDYIKPDSIVWDIGANVGILTFAAAGLATAGQVLAVEADPWLAQLLRRTLTLSQNKSLDVIVLSVAIADRIGVLEFVIASRGRASNYLAAAGGWTQSGGVRQRVHVPTLTLDALMEQFAAPTFVKIDVEGAELLVLRGASRLLRDARPTLYIEVGLEHAQTAAALLREHNYVLFDSKVPIAAQSPLDVCVQDTLAIPAEAVTD